MAFPGATLAAEVVGRYEARYGVPPAVVAGDWWLAGNVCCFAPSRPTLYSSREPAGAGHDPRRDRGDPRRFAWPEPETAPWTGDDDLRRRGGVLVWDAATYGEDMPDWLQRAYPRSRGRNPALALAVDRGRGAARARRVGDGAAGDGEPGALGTAEFVRITPVANAPGSPIRAH